MQYHPRSYQTYASDQIFQHARRGLFLDMGLGKTVATLTAIDRLVKHCEIVKCLVIAPKLVCEHTWPAEIEQWDHLQGLRVSKIIGNEKQRKAAIHTEADLYLIGCDNVPWLVAILQGWWPFDMVVIDESTRFKNHASKRFKAIITVLPWIDRMVLLTGTPLGNGYIDLWAQLYLLDKGQRLGEKITSYRNLYFTKNYSGWGYTPKDKLHQEVITDRISDICISMRREDYIKLPPRIEAKKGLKMDAELKLKYREFERERVMEFIESGATITAVNAAALTNKLLQFANGAVYDKDRNVHHIHDLKLEALAEIMEDANGHPVLVFYEYQHDVDRIMKYLAAWKPVLIDGKDTIQRWNKKQIPLLCAHVNSAGHGLNLQHGGHIMVFFGHNWSGEKRQQAIMRIERPGQLHSVVVNDLVLLGTMDEEVLRAQAGKISDEKALMEAVKVRIEFYKKELMYDI